MDASTESFDKQVILVVDDERGPRESLRMILSPSYDVLLAKRGTEALEVLRENGSSERSIVTKDAMSWAFRYAKKKGGTIIFCNEV